MAVTNLVLARAFKGDLPKQGAMTRRQVARKYKVSIRRVDEAIRLRLKWRPDHWDGEGRI